MWSCKEKLKLQNKIGRKKREESATGVGRYFAALKVRRVGASEVRSAHLGGYSISSDKSFNAVSRAPRVTSTRAARQHSNLPKTAKLTRARSTEAPAAAPRYNTEGVGGVREQGLE
jgi:hypothetical protein